MAALHVVMLDLIKQSRAANGAAAKAHVGKKNPDGGLMIYVRANTGQQLSLALARARVYPSEQELRTVIRKIPVRAWEIEGTRAERVTDDGRRWLVCEVSLEWGVETLDR